MAKIRSSNSVQVDQYIAGLPAELQPAIEYLRQVLLSADKRMAEHVKWNSPAFYYSGEMKEFDPKEYRRDILVMNLRKNKIMCVLPRGMYLTGNTEILEGNYTDGRRIIHFENLEDIQKKETRVKQIIQECISLLDT